MRPLSAWRRLDGTVVPLWIFLLHAYRTLLGPLMSGACRFEPTCSHYAETAVRRHGTLRGGWLTLRRLARCHPFHAGGHDQVPDTERTGDPAGPRQMSR